MDNRLRDRIRETFNDDIIEVAPAQQEIRVYYLRDPQGRAWVPYGGGPLYNDKAIHHAAWRARHIEEFRSLLPKRCRTWKIVFGELNTRNFPGTFYPQPLPPEPAKT